MRFLLLALAILSGACASELELSVDVKTDLVPGVEFDRVRVFLNGAMVAEADASLGESDFGESSLTGERVADLSGLEKGEYELRVVLDVPASGATQERTVLVDLDESLAVVVVLTRDCRNVACPGDGSPSAISCLGGSCVDPTCVTGNEPSCPEPECTENAQCGTSVECAIGICAANVCLEAPSDDRCESGEYCSPEEGCLPVPVRFEDAGTEDAAMEDAAMEDAGRDVGPDASPDVGPDASVEVDCPEPCTQLVVTNTALSGPGSLRDAQRIVSEAAPACAQNFAIVFDIPNEDAGFLTEGGQQFWRIAEPVAVTYAFECPTIIDGATQTLAHGDTNSAVLGEVMVGANPSARPPLDGPEIDLENIEIELMRAGSAVRDLSAAQIRLHPSTLAERCAIGTLPYNIAFRYSSGARIRCIGGESMTFREVVVASQSDRNAIQLCSGVRIEDSYLRLQAGPGFWDLWWADGRSDWELSRSYIEGGRCETGIEGTNSRGTIQDSTFETNCTVAGIRVVGNADFDIARTIVRGGDGPGILVGNYEGTAGHANIRESLSFENAGIGIDLSNSLSPNGASAEVGDCGTGDASRGNRALPAPSIRAGEVVGEDVVIRGTACIGGEVELFASDTDFSGSRFLAQVAVEPDGTWQIVVPSAEAGASVTATVTHPDYGTSEFSAAQSTR